MPELRFDPAARPALLGLLYRALAGHAEAGRSSVTRRRIEQLQAGRTEFLKERSSLSVDLETARAREKNARRSAADARLDVQIFNENHPPPPDTRRGIARLKPDQRRRDWEQQRDDLARIAQDEEEQAAEYALILREIEQRLQLQREESDALEREYAEQLALLRGQLSAWVLLQHAGAHSEEASEALADYRRLLRGELSVAVLLSLSTMLSEGPQRALATLGDLATIWEQHPDPLRPLLEALYRWQLEGRVGRREAGLPLPERFSQPAHWNLLRLVRILGGWPVESAEQDDSGFSPTLWALEQVLLTQTPPAGWQAQSAEGLAAWSGGADSVVQLLCCLALWQRGEIALIPLAAGLPFREIRPPERRGEEWPGLYLSLSSRPLPAWPGPLSGIVWSELACLVLLSAQRHAPDPLYRHWLAESYNWTKTPCFWWCMARLQEDPAMLRRLPEAPPGLIAVDSASL